MTAVREILFILTFATCCSALPKTIRIAKVEHCDPIVDYPLKISAKFRTVQGVQYFDFYANYTIPFAYNATVDFHVAVSKNGKNFVHLLSLREDDVCKFHKKYMGIFYDQILLRLGLQKGQCPVPKGMYQIKNMKLDFSSIPVHAFPTGIIRARQVVESKLTKKVLSCVAFEVTSQ